MSGSILALAPFSLAAVHYLSRYQVQARICRGLGSRAAVIIALRQMGEIRLGVPGLDLGPNRQGAVGVPDDAGQCAGALGGEV